MRNHVIALAVTVTLAAGSVAAYAATANFSDINNHWAQSDIQEVVGRNVMTGYSDGQFHPDAWVTRAEFSSMTAKTLGLPPQQSTALPGVRKVAQNSWNFSTVDNQTWISAYPTGVFRPENPVRRVEALAGLAGTLNKPMVSESEATQILSKYTDANQVPAAARTEVATAIKYDLFEVDPKTGSNQIDPLRPATRGEVAAMLNNLYDKRDIALVQNGQLISQSTTTTTSSYSSTTGTDGQTSTSYGQTTTGTTTTGQTAAAGTTGSTYGTNQQASSTTQENTNNWLRTSGTPYRNSADTIREFQAVNTTIVPSNMKMSEEATNPIALAPNTTFTGTLAKALYSEFNRPGDPVMLILDHALMDANGRIIAPAGSRVLGVVDHVISNNIDRSTAELGLKFNGILTPNGQRIPMNATVNSQDGVLKAGEIQGVTFRPFHSTDALSREISASQGSLYGMTMGKAWVLEQPVVAQASDQPLAPIDLKPDRNIVLGVGDKLQLKIENIGVNATQEQNSSTQ